MTDEVELTTFTVTLLAHTPPPGTGPGVALENATFEEAVRAFGVDLPPSLPGRLIRREIAMSRREADPVLVADYISEGTGQRACLSYILIPASVYEMGPDGKRRYIVLADTMERKLLGGSVVVAMATQNGRSATNPAGVTAIWEKEGLLALAVTDGMAMSDIELAVLQMA